MTRLLDVNQLSQVLGGTSSLCPWLQCAGHKVAVLWMLPTGPPVRTPCGCFCHDQAVGSCQSMKRQGSVALNQNYQLNPLCAILREDPGWRPEECVSFSSKKRMLFPPSPPPSCPEVLTVTQGASLDLFFWNEKINQKHTISLTEKSRYICLKKKNLKKTSDHL